MYLNKSLFCQLLGMGGLSLWSRILNDADEIPWLKEATLDVLSYMSGNENVISKLLQKNKMLFGFGLAE